MGAKKEKNVSHFETPKPKRLNFIRDFVRDLDWDELKKKIQLIIRSRKAN